MLVLLLVPRFFLGHVLINDLLCWTLLLTLNLVSWVLKRHLHIIFFLIQAAFVLLFHLEFIVLNLFLRIVDVIHLNFQLLFRFGVSLPAKCDLATEIFISFPFWMSILLYCWNLLFLFSRSFLYRIHYLRRILFFVFI